MSILAKGRVNQKLRTRNALVEAASQLLRDGKSFTVADVADLARVGRTTAYRYFPSVETLVAQASLHALTEVEKRSMDVALEGVEPVEKRLRIVFEASDKAVSDHEYLFRTMLRSSLNGDGEQGKAPPRRSGTRAAVLDSAIGVLRRQLGEKRYEKLTAALSVLLGIEGAVALRDVCLLSKDKAREVKLWGANALLQAALTEVATRQKPHAANQPGVSGLPKKKASATAKTSRHKGA